MFSLNFRKTGWLIRYFIFRASTPFTVPDQYLENLGEEINAKIFDELLYKEVKQNGMLFGCPVISRGVQKLADELNFPNQQGGTILLYLETLFSVALIENGYLTSNKQDADTIPYEILTSFGNRIKKVYVY